ncbi:hypothetical protein B0A69_04925 [Chryseobacterium shigense]|uniref:Uncharacterized protein n=1 Tax=Chryseobacterium shigense TaxID=297244 RepID=A0A1N7INI7_9FLAO|nr:hypothetical protein [Chryseobacterium shigense]PQA95719.1 hypothetical protein B0A69_04925 [Chryseobacterium shigense]SIS38639.1 hypothetical protein SAMN05421639_104283 [Chryseobacterium shigense]
MRNKFYIIFTVTIGSLAFGQVGINTQNPQGIFNIDGGKNNVATGTPTEIQLADDFIVTASGSTGIGADPDASAILELNVSQLAATNKKGFLGPRVALTAYDDAVTIPSPATGLLVFNLGTSALTYQGYVYWDSSQWRSFNGRSLQPGTISSLRCTDGTLEPLTYTSGVPFAGTLSVAYTGGNGGIYPAQSMGPVNGLTATLSQSNFAQGSGTLNYRISGTPTVSSPNTTTFPLSIGGQSCSASVGPGKVLAAGEYQFFTYRLPATYVGLLSTQIGSSFNAVIGGKVRLDLNFTVSSNQGSGVVSYNPRLINVSSGNIKLWYASSSSIDHFRRSNVLLAPGGYMETDNGIYLNWGDNMNGSSTAVTATSFSDDSQEIETVDLIVDLIWYRITVFVSVDNLNDNDPTNNIRRVFMTAQRMSS